MDDLEKLHHAGAACLTATADIGNVDGLTVIDEAARRALLGLRYRSVSGPPQGSMTRPHLVGPQCAMALEVDEHARITAEIGISDLLGRVRHRLSGRVPDRVRARQNCRVARRNYSRKAAGPAACTASEIV
jgi:hypothetical protein